MVSLTIDVVPVINDIEITIDNVNRVPTEVFEKYQGDYEVIPKRETQILNTKEKVMSDDVTIREIPFYQTSNLSGGTTCYIAKEVNK